MKPKDMEDVHIDYVANYFVKEENEGNCSYDLKEDYEKMFEGKILD